VLAKAPASSLSPVMEIDLGTTQEQVHSCGLIV
jgi:hypothetical protein